MTAPLIHVVDLGFDAAIDRSDYTQGRGTRVTKNMEEPFSDESVPANVETNSSSPCCTYSGSSKDLSNGPCRPKFAESPSKDHLLLLSIADVAQR